MSAPPTDPSESGSRATATGVADRADAPASPLPTVGVPKGGGSIRGMGEKFSVNAATGTGSFTVPLQVSPARGGFGPQLALSYDSGAGNGPFGLGWALAIPEITRKTDKGLPRYDDEDVFVLSGTEDLVRLLDGSLAPVTRTETVGAASYVVDRFVPRVEGLYARIERWTDQAGGDVHWRTISTEDVTTLYGTTAESRVADPGAPWRVATWLAAESYDDKGNAVLYRYQAEDGEGVDVTAAHERNRTTANRGAQRYLKAVRYGNRVPRRPGDDLVSQTDWMFEVVLDYGEHDPDDAQGAPATIGAGSGTRPWAVRTDPFSSYRTGFEVRTYRLCRRVLLFHHFPAELGTNDCLVNAVHLTHDETPQVTRLVGVTFSGYVRRTDGTYLKRSLPPLALRYSEAVVDDTVHDVDPASLENLPTGSSRRRWVDVLGDGVAGLLAEEGDSWVYKRNVSPTTGVVAFAPAQVVAARPVTGGDDGWQWLDVAGDGQPDLVNLERSVGGFHERASDGGWKPFRPFTTVPLVPWETGDVTLVDLTGDGRPDVLVTTDDSVVWHRGDGDGFGPADVVANALDEERGPRVVLAAAAESIHLADLSGDGLADLVRVRPGDVCYWPNLGYGRFGAKVTMDGLGWLDSPDAFDGRRVRFADVDGSGPADLLYVDAGGDVVVRANQSGNGWGPACRVTSLGAGSDRDIDVADLRGNGTSCLVWTSRLPADEARRLRYVDLADGAKPHLLVEVDNGMGAVTRVQYASSARFAIEDDLAGHPWATRLPFPVPLLERVQVDDLVNRCRFTTRYAYHHGYFDGPEREFRGFGLVEQWDTEELAALTGADELPPANVDPASHVPPTLTRSWFHTGAYLDGPRLEARFAEEYYAEPGLDPLQRRALLRNDTVLPTGLTPDEEREATRALKGVLLRKEVYGLDGSPAEPHPYTVSEHNYDVDLLQRRGPNRYAVVRTHARETVDLQYDRAVTLVGGKVVADPRTHHQVVLEVDAFGNLLRSVDVVYGRRHPDPALAPADQAVQARTLVTCNVNGYTKAVDTATARRAPQLCETRAYEILGVASTALASLDDLRAAVDAASDGAHDLPYEDVGGAGATPGQPFRRLIEHTQSLFRRDDLSGPLPLGELEALALPYETYVLAFTPSLLTKVYGTRVTPAMLTGEGGYVQPAGSPDWWTTTGRTFLSPDPSHSPAQELAYARQHFFLTQRAVDPLGNASSVRYDDHDLLPVDMVDAVGNRTTAGERDTAGKVVARLDYRTLQPALVTDLNRNRTAVAYDALGRVAGVAVMGKPTDAVGDSLAGFAADLDEPALDAFLADPIGTAPGLLGAATRRIVYDLDRFPQPAYSATLAREHHVADGGAGVQITLSHADGAGRVAQQKVRVAPGPVVDGGPTVDPRWVGSAWTVLDNKGQAVRTYEPFFSATHTFEFAREEGVGAIACYDPVGRVVATLQPNHTYEKTVFGLWSQEGWTANDTVLVADPADDPDVGDFFARLQSGDYLPTWHAARAGGALGPAEQDAATKASALAGSPSRNHCDALGRSFLVVETVGATTVRTRLELDIEGNTVGVIDALGRTAVESDFDVQGRRLRQASIDGGDRWQLPDVVGRTIRSWTGNGAVLRSVYDPLGRVVELHVSEAGGPERLAERMVYGESQGDALNHRGQVFEHYDGAGVIVHEAYDLAGSLLRQRRKLASALTGAPDWATSPALEAEEFVTSTEFDALQRAQRVEAPDGTVTRLAYDEGGLLARVEANVRGEAAVTVFLAGVEQNAKGEPVRVEHGNGVVTTYAYDRETFALQRLATIRGTTVLQDLVYARDPRGSVTSRRDDASQTVFFGNAVVGAEVDFTYDSLRRLVQARGREHVGQGPQQPTYESHDAPRVGLAHPNDGQAMQTYTETYGYDAVGNLLEVAHAAAQGSWTRRYQYAAASNRLESTSMPGDPTAGPLPVRYAHDAHGNLTAMPHLAAMAWDFKDRLRSVDLGGGGTAHYAYDTDGQRVRKVVLRQNGTRQREQLYLGRVEIQREYAGNGTTVTLERQTFHAGSGNAALVETRTQGSDPGADRLVRFQLPDALGSVALELDDTGAVISAEEYHPYGTTSYQAVRSQTQAPKRYRYNGKERDGETGLAYYGARYYAPWLGRWTAADPAGMVDGANLFAYARGNPTNVTDPTGREGFEGLSNEGKYAHRVTFKNMDEYVASDAGSDHVVNPDGTVTATVWKKTPPVTIAPQKPAPKPAPAKPKPKPVEKPKTAERELSNHELLMLARALQPRLIYPKPVRQFFGGLQFVGGVLEAGGGAFAAVVTSETVVGAAAGGAVALHGIDNATSGWTLMMTGEESKTWTFMAGAGYASMFTDDRELQMAIGSATDTAANLGSAGYGLYSLSATSPRLAVPSAVLDAEAVAGTGVNTGPGFVGRINCGFCTAAGADAVPMTSTEQAAFAGLSEAGAPGLYIGQFEDMLRGRGLLGQGVTADVMGATAADAQAYMSMAPPGTKFAIYHGWSGGGAHYVNARVGRFGLYFIDNQKALGAWRPYFNLPPNATNVYVWTVYSPLF